MSEQEHRSQQEQINALNAAMDDYDTAIGQIAAEVATLAGAAGDGSGSGSNGLAGGWSAYGADPQAYQARLADLRTWFAWAHPVIFFPRNSAREFPACWEEHPGVVEELLALHAAWLAAYGDGRPNEGRIAWHDRWVGPFLARVDGSYGLNECRREDRHIEPATLRTTHTTQPAPAGV